MATKIRNTFETNSSSVHSFSIISEAEYQDWRNNKCYIYIEYECFTRDTDVWKDFNKRVKARTKKHFIYTPKTAKDFIKTKEWSWLGDESKNKLTNIFDKVISGELAFDDRESNELLGEYGFYTYREWKDWIDKADFDDIQESVCSFEAFNKRKYKKLAIIGFYGFD